MTRYAISSSLSHVHVYILHTFISVKHAGSYNGVVTPHYPITRYPEFYNIYTCDFALWPIVCYADSSFYAYIDPGSHHYTYGLDKGVVMRANNGRFLNATMAVLN